MGILSSRYRPPEELRSALERVLGRKVYASEDAYCTIIEALERITDRLEALESARPSD